jgi:hypothetical protein
MAREASIFDGYAADASGTVWTDTERGLPLILVRVEAERMGAVPTGDPEKDKALFVTAHDRAVFTRRCPAVKLLGNDGLVPGDTGRQIVERDVLAKVLSEVETVVYSAVKDHGSLDREGFDRHRAAAQIGERVRDRLRARYRELSSAGAEVADAGVTRKEAHL